jgi:hypothetical protein
MVKSAMCTIETATNESGGNPHETARDFESQRETEAAVSMQQLARIAPILYLFLLDSRLNVYAFGADVS